MKHLQNRSAPAFQEYAATMLADFTFRSLSPSWRGVLYTLRLECWANKRLPADPCVLSKALGMPKDVITDCLPHLNPFFKIQDGWLFSPELEDYRKYLDDVRKSKSEGGKKGAAKTNAHRKTDDSEVRDTQRDSRDCLEQYSQVQPSTAKINTATNERSSLDDDWVNDYEKTTYG